MTLRSASDFGVFLPYAVRTAIASIEGAKVGAIDREGLPELDKFAASHINWARKVFAGMGWRPKPNPREYLRRLGFSMDPDSGVIRLRFRVFNATVKETSSARAKAFEILLPICQAANHQRRCFEAGYYLAFSTESTPLAEGGELVRRRLPDSLHVRFLGAARDYERSGNIKSGLGMLVMRPEWHPNAGSIARADFFPAEMPWITNWPQKNEANRLEFAVPGVRWDWKGRQNWRANVL